jgi:hypothetical protein
VREMSTPRLQAPPKKLAITEAVNPDDEWEEF